MTASLRVAALALMSQRAPPPPRHSGGVFAVGLVNRACIQLQAAFRCKIISSQRLGEKDNTRSLAGRLELLKKRATVSDSLVRILPSVAEAAAGDHFTLMKTTRDLHLSKAPVEDASARTTARRLSSSDELELQQLGGRERALSDVELSSDAVEQNGASTTSDVVAQSGALTEEQRLRKFAAHQQVVQVIYEPRDYDVPVMRMFGVCIVLDGI
jgi:hypothetical protein